MRVCGVDDAGRGPVIGPLVIAGVIIEEDKLDLLKMLGVRDSKQLLSSARTRLSKEIPGVVDDYHVLEIESQELDRIVNRAPKFQRLNLLEAKVMAQVIEKLKPDLVYVDSSDTRIDRLVRIRRLRQMPSRSLVVRVTLTNHRRLRKNYSCPV